MDIEKLRKDLLENSDPDGPCIEDDLMQDAATALSTIPALQAELEKVMRERDAAQSLLAERIGVRGAESITTAFGLPIDRLRELAQADKENRVLPEGSGWFVTCSGKKLTVVMDIEAALRRKQDG